MIIATTVFSDLFWDAVPPEHASDGLLHKETKQRDSSYSQEVGSQK